MILIITRMKVRSKAYESAVEKLKHLEFATMEKVGKMKDKADEMTELGKEVFNDTKGHLTKAVNAAVIGSA